MKKKVTTTLTGVSLSAEQEEALPETPSGAIWKSALQVSPCFLLSGMGMVASGALLDWATENVTVFEQVPSLIALVPALLGLKGNLEMTLGARLGSHANNSELQGATLWPIASGNAMVVQCQAIVVGAAAALLAILTEDAQGSWVGAEVGVFLAASAIAAASLASLVLSCLMIAIVICASRAGIDPDNITAPLAGMLGDFVTLGIVILLASTFWNVAQTQGPFLLIVILAIYAVLAILFAVVSCKNKYTVEIVQYGWYPVLASMLLSLVSGQVSEYSITDMKFGNFPLFQVVMNGAGGNVAAILAAKMSTELVLARSELEQNLSPNSSNDKRRPSIIAKYRPLLKEMTTMGEIKSECVAHEADPHMLVNLEWVDVRSPQTYTQNWVTLRVLTQPGGMARFARMLLLLIIPGQVLFSCVVIGVASKGTAFPTPLFVVCFVAASLCQVCFLMMAARTLVVMLWRKHLDPDNGVSPLVCGMGDLLGTSLLMVVFMVLRKLDGEVWPGGGI